MYALIYGDKVLLLLLLYEKKKIFFGSSWAKLPKP